MSIEAINEIVAQSTGTSAHYPDVRTIIEIVLPW